MEDSGIDAAMMDVIGAQETITQVYHLSAAWTTSSARWKIWWRRASSVPHIVLGLHYGAFSVNGRAGNAAPPPAVSVVLVVVMPFYAPAHRPFGVPDSLEVAVFFSTRGRPCRISRCCSAVHARRSGQGRDRYLCTDGRPERHRASC